MMGVPHHVFFTGGIHGLFHIFCGKVVPFSSCTSGQQMWRLILESAIYGAVNISDLFRPQESPRHELSNAAFAICSESNPRAGM